jgi:hypothetical protein
MVQRWGKARALRIAADERRNGYAVLEMGGVTSPHGVADDERHAPRLRDTNAEMKANQRAADTQDQSDEILHAPALSRKRPIM